MIMSAPEKLLCVHSAFYPMHIWVEELKGYQIVLISLKSDMNSISYELS
jgi:hypothetical protein